MHGRRNAKHPARAVIKQTREQPESGILRGMALF
jgi:hypothetical protein